MARIAHITTPQGTTTSLSPEDVNEIALALFDLAVAERAPVERPAQPLATPKPYYHGTWGDWAGLPSPQPDRSTGFANVWPTGIFVSPELEFAEGIVGENASGLDYRPKVRIFETSLSRDQIYGGEGVHPIVPPGQDERDLYLPVGWGQLLDELKPYLNPERQGWDVREAIDAYLADHPDRREKLPANWEQHIEEAGMYNQTGFFHDALEDYWQEVSEDIAGWALGGVEGDHGLGGWQYSDSVEWAQGQIDSREWERDPRHVAIKPPNYYRSGDFGYDSDQVIILKPFGVRWTDIHADFIPDPYQDLESIREIRGMADLPGNEWLRRIVRKTGERADWLTREELTPQDWDALKHTEWWTRESAPGWWPSIEFSDPEEALGFDPSAPRRG